MNRKEVAKVVNGHGDSFRGELPSELGKQWSGSDHIPDCQTRCQTKKKWSGFFSNQIFPFGPDSRLSNSGYHGTDCFTCTICMYSFFHFHFRYHHILVRLYNSLDEWLDNQWDSFGVLKNIQAFHFSCIYSFFLHIESTIISFLSTCYWYFLRDKKSTSQQC